MPSTFRRFCLSAMLLLAAQVTAAGVARADVLSFTYAFATGDVLAARLFGTLEGDGNTFDVTGQAGVAFNGADVGFVPDYLQSFSDFYAGATPSVSSTGRLTLDGSFADLISYSEAAGGFDLTVGDNLPYSPNIGVFGFSDLNDQAFAAARFSASVEVTPVPEPATPLLLLLGLLAARAARRRVPPAQSIP